MALDNPIRFIDAFVRLIDLNKTGFTTVVLKTEESSEFQEQIFLKIYLYDYLNNIRNSIKLEKSSSEISRCNDF
ncbi:MULTISPECIES: hypothetical protein [Flavobacterium]|uniref:Uncharacterized protein n=1 Tax=Flavobacterium covae TaxID=2906076 RepID=A0ABW8PGJ5_9FLAO|nr:MULTISPECIES: hypothetical protein [Flavobacterium]